MKHITLISGILLSCIILASSEPSPTEIALAKESEAQCAATAATKPTPQIIIQKVEEACALLAKEGDAALPKFKGKSSSFLFAGTYIWIHDMNGVMIMHPIKPSMVGQHLIGLKDSNGKLFFTEMNNLVRDKGAGWVDYYWPKPGEKDRSLKVSYVKKTAFKGKEYVVGCGVYDITLEEIQKAAAK